MLKVLRKFFAFDEPLTSHPEHKRAVWIIADIPDFIDTDSGIHRSFG